MLEDQELSGLHSKSEASLGYTIQETLSQIRTIRLSCFGGHQCYHLHSIMLLEHPSLPYNSRC